MPQLDGGLLAEIERKRRERDARTGQNFSRQPEGYGNDPSQWYMEGQGYTQPPSYAGLIDRPMTSPQRPQMKTMEDVSGQFQQRNIGLLDDAKKGLMNAQNWMSGGPKKTAEKPFPPGTYSKPHVPRTIRNNNPMALNLNNGGGRRIPYEGLRETQDDVQLSNETSPMGQYENKVMGLRAGIVNFKYQADNMARQNKSMTELMSAYHGTEKSKAHSKSYAGHVLRSLGVKGDPDKIKVKDINFDNNESIYKVITAIFDWEGGSPEGMDESTIRHGIDLTNKTSEDDFQFGSTPDATMTLTKPFPITSSTRQSPPNLGLGQRAGGTYGDAEMQRMVALSQQLQNQSVA